MGEQDLIAVARETIDGFNAGAAGPYKATLASDVVYGEVGTQRRIEGANALVQCWGPPMARAKRRSRPPKGEWEGR